MKIVTNGRRIVMCVHVDQHCGTCEYIGADNVRIGSTLHDRTIVMPEQQFLGILATKTATAALAEILTAQELDEMFAYDGPTAVREARSLAGLPVLVGTAPAPVSV